MDVFEDRLKGVGILGILRIVPKEQVGEEPLPKQAPLLAQHFIKGHAELIGELQVEVMGLHPNAVGLQNSGQSPQLDRRILAGAERHVDEGDGDPAIVDRHGGS
jgi:hypothetical protein